MKLSQLLKPRRHLICCALLLSLQTPSHYRVNCYFPIKWGSWKQGRIPRAPLDIKTPLVCCCKLINDLKPIKITSKHPWVNCKTAFMTEGTVTQEYKGTTVITSPVFGFQQRILLSFALLSRSSESAWLQDIDRIPLKKKKRINNM